MRKYMSLYGQADKWYKERDRTKNAWQAIEIALRYVEGKNNGLKLNDFKYKKHTQKAAGKGVCRCSAVLNLRKKSLKNTCDIIPVEIRVGVNLTHHQTIKVELLSFLPMCSVYNWKMFLVGQPFTKTLLTFQCSSQLSCTFHRSWRYDSVFFYFSR